MRCTCVSSEGPREGVDLPDPIRGGTPRRGAGRPARVLLLGLGLGLGLAAGPGCAGARGGGAGAPGSTAGTQLHLRIAPADEDADVYVDGNYVGQLSEVQGTVAGPMLLAPGKHRVEIRKDGRFPFQRTVEIDPAGGPARVELEVELLEDPR